MTSTITTASIIATEQSPRKVKSREYSADDREKIANKITALLSDAHSLVFFEFHPAENLYYLIHQGHRHISFSKNESTSEKVRAAAKKLLLEAFHPIDHVIFFRNFTIIDDESDRIYTTVASLNENRYRLSNIPRRSFFYTARTKCSIIDDFLRDMFAHLTESNAS